MSHCENSNLRKQKEQGQSRLTNTKKAEKKNTLRSGKGFVKRECVIAHLWRTVTTRSELNGWKTERKKTLNRIKVIGSPFADVTPELKKRTVIGPWNSCKTCLTYRAMITSLSQSEVKLISRDLTDSTFHGFRKFVCLNRMLLNFFFCFHLKVSIITLKP